MSLVSFDRLLGADNYKEPEMILIKRIGDTNELEKLNFPIGLGVERVAIVLLRIWLMHTI